MANENDMLPIPACALLTITAGNYSEYRVLGVFRTTTELKPAALLQEYLKEFPAAKTDYEDYAFLGWLAQRGLLERLDCYEWLLSEGYTTPGQGMRTSSHIPARDPDLDPL